MAEAPLIVAQATRPFPGEVVCGDLAIVDWPADGCRIALVDGLGHGPEALAAALAAKQALAAHPDLPPEEALRRCHRALAGTRGAAMSIVRIEPAAHRLIYAGVGNVEARLWQPDREQRLVPARGIVGMVLPSLRALEIPLGLDWLLLLHTDGVSARFVLTEFGETPSWEPRPLAEAVLARYAREMDDATVVVASPARG